MPSYKSVAVIGAGAWGTALAAVAARAGRDVVLYARSAASAAGSRHAGRSETSGARLDASVEVTDDIALAAAADIILIATPAQDLREAVTALAPHLASAKPVIACARASRRGTHRFMTG
jgi:glycerol-3-phosphate dehydrogenase (NAD(P)+)